MQWQAPVDGPLQYLWTVHYQYDGTRESNLLSCDLSSHPCQAADPDRGRALALLPPALLATSSPPIFAYGAPMACVFCEPRRTMRRFATPTTTFAPITYRGKRSPSRLRLSPARLRPRMVMQLLRGFGDGAGRTGEAGEGLGQGARLGTTMSLWGHNSGGDRGDTPAAGGGGGRQDRGFCSRASVRLSPSGAAARPAWSGRSRARRSASPAAPPAAHRSARRSALR